MTRRALQRALARGAVALAALAWVPVASAQAVEVGSIRGPGGRVLARQLTDALAEAGLDRGEPTARVSGRVRRRRGGFVARLRIERGEEVTPLSRRAPTAASLVAELRDAIVAFLTAEAEAPERDEAPDPAPPDEDPAAAEPAPTPASGRPEPAAPPSNDSAWAPAALELGAGGGVLGRSLSFRDDLRDALGRYQLDAAPFAHARGRWFPLLHAIASPWLAVGLEAGAWAAFGISSRSSADDDASFDTVVDAVELGIVYRLPLGEHLLVEPAFGYVHSRFRVSAPGPSGGTGRTESVPDVIYEQVRPRLAVEVRLPFHLALRVDAAYLAVLSTGRLDDADWFPRSSTYGIELGGGVEWRFDRWVSARVFVVHARYVSDLAVQPGDPRIAGGALDEWTRGGFELTFVLPGAT